MSNVWSDLSLTANFFLPHSICEGRVKRLIWGMEEGEAEGNSLCIKTKKNHQGIAATAYVHTVYVYVHTAYV